MGSAGGALGLSALLAGAGAAHLLVPRPYEGIVPRALPGSPWVWTAGSGIAEIGCAALLAVPRTRRAGAGLAAALFVAMFPANVQMAIDWRDHAGLGPIIAYGRLPLQVPLVMWALHVRRRESTRRSIRAMRRRS